MHRIIAAALACCTLWAGQALAADNYSASFQGSTGAPQSTSSATLGGLMGDIGAVPLVPGRNFSLSLRGVSASLAASSALVGNSSVALGQLQIPSTGANAQFSGASWSAVVDQVRRFLLQGAEARRLQRESARSSPFDPVAGNPGSLMARMVAFDFGSAFSPFASNATDGPVQVAQAGGGLPSGALRGPLPTLPGVGVQISALRDDGRAQKSLGIPLSLSWRSDLDPRRQFSLSLPITVTDTDGARSVQGAFGAGLRLPLARDWAISGNLGYAILSAKDLGSAGKIASISVTSSYVSRGTGSDLAIGNMIGRYRTLSGTIGGIDTGSGISNTVLRNGVLWSMPAPQWAGAARSIEYTFVNTHYSGTELYLRSYAELGVSLGSNKRADSTRSYMQGGLSYLFSSKTKGVLASFGYWF